MIAIISEEFLWLPVLAAIVLSVVLPYFGIQIIKRGIVFIDLALAQIASLGVAVALFFGGSAIVYSLIFTLIGAITLFLAGLNRDQNIQEGIIGTFYALSSGLTILIISKMPHGDSDVTNMLFGNLLAISTENLVIMAIVLVLAGGFVLIFRNKIVLEEGKASEKFPTKENIFWNVIFYVALAFSISYSIKVAGVLLVFSYLIIPAISAILVISNNLKLVIISILLAVIGSLMGIEVSYVVDLPLGASIIVLLGIIFIVFLVISVLCQNKKFQMVSDKETENPTEV